MKNKILLEQEAINKLKKGVDKITNVIKLTLGPRGRFVFLQNEDGSFSHTKDGATIARSINLEDPVMQAGASLVRESATQTENNVGDGTTTSSILTQAILEKGIDAINAGRNPILVSRGIKQGVEEIVNNLEKYKSEIKNPEQLKSVASIAANDSKIGEKIAEVFEKIGKNGVVMTEESPQPGVFYEIVDGLQIDKGYVTPYFVTDIAKKEAVGENYLVFLTKEKLVLEDDIVPILEQANLEMTSGTAKGLLIISESIEGTALKIAVVSNLNGSMPMIAVNAPSFGDNRQNVMQDIANLSGGKIFDIDSREGKTDVKSEDFGLIQKVVCENNKTTIKGYESRKKEISSYVKSLQKELEKTVAEFDKEKLQERIAKLTSGIAFIKIGAQTESEAREIRYRIDDAIGSTQAALEEGTVPGGGVALLRASLSSNTHADDEDVEFGIKIIKEACLQPIKVLIENAGGNISEIIKGIKNSSKSSFGFNAETHKLSDLTEDGVLDSFKGVRSALLNAVSVATLLLNTGATISLKKEQTNQ